MSGMVPSSSPGSVKIRCAPGVKCGGGTRAQLRRRCEWCCRRAREPRRGPDGQQGDPHGDHHALPRGRTGRHRAVVGSNDCRDDREPQTAAATRPGPRRIDPVETFEDTARLLFGHSWPAVTHLDLRLVPDLVHAHRRRGARWRVGSHIRQEVVDDLAQAVRVPGPPRRGGPPRTARAIRDPPRSRSAPPPMSGQRVRPVPAPSEYPRPGGRAMSRSLTRRSMRAVSVRMPDTMRGRSSTVLRSAALEELGIGRHRGDGRTQLVGGVRDELAQVLLGFLEAGLGGEPRREGALDPFQHDVEGTGEAARPRSTAPLRAPAGRGSRRRWTRRWPRHPPEAAGRDGRATSRRPARARARQPSRRARSGRGCAVCSSGRRVPVPGRARCHRSASRRAPGSPDRPTRWKTS